MRTVLTTAAAAAAILSVAFSASAKDARIAGDKVVVGNMYAPFCRTEGPDVSEWPADIAKMKELGYTCLHGFCEWSRIEKAKGVYDFSQIDLLLDLCAKNGILAILNVATQNTVGYHMPAWMENEYAGRGMVDIDDDGVALKSIHNVPCLDDPWYRGPAEKFLKALARRYGGDGRVAGWVIWGEPLLHGESGKPICFCEHTQKRFREWAEKKYGTIERLNSAWSTEGPVDFSGFDAIRPPRGTSGHRGGYAAWNDWARFMTDNFACNIKWADSLLKEGGATQPTIVEMFTFPTGGGMVNDVWSLGRSADIVGSSCFLRPGANIELSLTVAASVAAREGKSFFVVEQTGGNRAYNYDHLTPCDDEIVSEAVQSAGLGAKGVMYWCWRPRFTDYEAGTYGMCRADGKPLPRAVAGGRNAAAVAALGERLADAERRPQVAILHPDATFASADGVEEQCFNGETGALRLFFDARVTPQIVSAEMIRDGLDASLRALVLPFAYALDQSTCDGIRRFVERGGCVIADHNLAFKQSDGRVWRTLPGGGLDKVFGFEKEEDLFIDHKCLLPKDNRYGIIEKDFMDIVTPTTAEVLERDGTRPLILRNRIGKGEAYAFSFCAFPEYAKNGGNVALRRLVMSFLEPYGVKPFAQTKGYDDSPYPHIRVAELVRKDGSKVLTFTNPGWETRDVEATVPGAAAVSPFLCGDVAVDVVGATARFTLKPWQSIMLQAEMKGWNPDEVRRRYAAELYERIVPFWTKHSIDRECGGYLHCLGRDGSVYDTFKDMWMEWREVYMFAALANAGHKNGEWIDLARHGYDFLYAKGRMEDGSYCTRMNRDGTERTFASDGTEVFTSGFAAMACAELFRATGEEKYSVEAKSCWAAYRRLAARHETKYRQLAHRVIGLNVMNVFNEAFAGAYADEAESLVREMKRFVEPGTGLMMERTRVDWSFDLDSQYGRFVNSGHTVEAMSFLFRHIAQSGKTEHLAFARDIALKMFDFGWDAEGGGGFVYRDAGGLPVDKTDWMLKTWWADCEAATAMLRGWSLTGDVRFLERFMLVDEYDWANFRDPDFPEWFAYAPVDGRRIHTYKGNVRKGFFHLPRRLLDCVAELEQVGSAFDKLKKGNGK